MRQFRHFVQENGSSVGFLEVAFPAFGSSGEGSFSWPKSSESISAFRNGSAVHGNVVSVFAGAVRMNDLRKELLAYPACRSPVPKDRSKRPAGLFRGAVQTFVVTDDPEALFYGR